MSTTLTPTAEDRLRARLERWLSEALPSYGKPTVTSLNAPLQGYSAKTWYADVDWTAPGRTHRSQRLVLRIQPEAGGLFLDADIIRQAQTMRTVAENSQVPVPAVLGSESDPAVLGAPFFVMTFVDARVPKDIPPYNAVGWLSDLPPEARRQVWLNGLDAVADVNRIDAGGRFPFLQQPTRGAGLDSYMQWVEDWYEWSAPVTHDVVLDAALRELQSQRPKRTDVSVVWGDARPGNLMYANDLSVAAMLDWEMATLGPAEIDLGWWLFCDRFYSEGFGLRVLEGLPARAETIAHYEERLGRAVRDIDYFILLGAFRMATVLMRSATVRNSPGDPTPDTAPVNPATCIVADLIGAPVPELPPMFAEYLRSLSEGKQPD